MYTLFDVLPRIPTFNLSVKTSRILHPDSKLPGYAYGINSRLGHTDRSFGQAKQIEEEERDKIMLPMF